MIAPCFWQKRGVLALLLAPLGWVYGQITLARMNRKGYKASIPVICVGNATLGGTGKTPVVLALVKLLKAQGKRPVILTRGYGGKTKQATFVQDHSAQEVGDEAKMMSLTSEVIVSPHRAQGAKLAEELNFECIVMDDGFQNPQLQKDFTFCVVDKGAQGNGFIFPAGELRAPFKPQLALAHAVILTGEGNCNEEFEKPVFETHSFASSTLPHETPILAFCGIGRPEKFQETIKALGFRDVDFRIFPDHHVYTDNDISHLNVWAAQEKRTFLTTTKDAVKLPFSVEIVDFELKFTNEADFLTLLGKIVA